MVDKPIVMKVRCILLLLATALLLPGHTAQAQLLIGPVAGGQMGWISFQNRDNSEQFRRSPYFGFHAGASVQYRMHKRVFLQTSILYTQRGKTLHDRIDQSVYTWAKYNYLDMPILFTKEFKMRLGPPDKVKFYNIYIGAGPLVSYWMSGKGYLTSADLNENTINPPTYDLHYKVVFNKNPEDVNLGEMNVENPNRIQLGLNFSAGVVFEPNRLNKIMVTAKYELGHSFFSRQSDGDFGLPGILYYKDDLQVRNKSLSLSLFYYFDLHLDEKNKGKSTIKLDKIQKTKRRR